jgi:hypothetical protein
MGRRGWIYLRVDRHRGYCFGKTEDPNRRDNEYRKENPFLDKVFDFEVRDMDAVEKEIIFLTAHLRLLSNSKEWLKLSDEVVDIVCTVRRKHAIMTEEEWRRQENEKRRVEKERIENLARIEQQQQRNAAKSSHIGKAKPCPGCRRSIRPHPGAIYRNVYVCRHCQIRFH